MQTKDRRNEIGCQCSPGLIFDLNCLINPSLDLTHHSAKDGGNVKLQTLRADVDGVGLAVAGGDDLLVLSHCVPFGLLGVQFAEKSLGTIVLILECFFYYDKLSQDKRSHCTLNIMSLVQTSGWYATDTFSASLLMEFTGTSLILEI